MLSVSMNEIIHQAEEKYLESVNREDAAKCSECLLEMQSEQDTDNNEIKGRIKANLILIAQAKDQEDIYRELLSALHYINMGINVLQKDKLLQEKPIEYFEKIYREGTCLTDEDLIYYLMQIEKIFNCNEQEAYVLHYLTSLDELFDYPEQFKK